MTTGTLDDPYLTWLYGQVAEVRLRKTSKMYWDLLRHLHTIEFVWFVPNDDNRMEDGRDLRTEWTHDTGIQPDPEWFSLGCTFLEMLVALARRFAFEADCDVSECFWQLIDNLELLDCSTQEIEDKVSAVIWRTYDRLGRGGLFPLQKSKRDQRRVEIWYQLSEYLAQEQ